MQNINILQAGRNVADTIKRDGNRVTVEDGGSPSWTVEMQEDRTVFTARRERCFEGDSWDVKVGPTGVDYKHIGRGFAPMKGKETHIAMPLQPEQYEWAGLNVIGNLIGVPLGLFFPPAGGQGA